MANQPKKLLFSLFSKKLLCFVRSNIHIYNHCCGESVSLQSVLQQKRAREAFKVAFDFFNLDVMFNTVKLYSLVEKTRKNVKKSGLLARFLQVNFIIARISQANIFLSRSSQAMHFFENTNENFEGNVFFSTRTDTKVFEIFRCLFFSGSVLLVECAERTFICQKKNTNIRSETFL